MCNNNNCLPSPPFLALRKPDVVRKAKVTKVILPHFPSLVFYQIKIVVCSLPYCRWFRTFYF